MAESPLEGFRTDATRMAVTPNFIVEDFDPVENLGAGNENTRSPE